MCILLRIRTCVISARVLFYEDIRADGGITLRVRAPFLMGSTPLLGHSLEISVFPFYGFCCNVRSFLLIDSTCLFDGVGFSWVSRFWFLGLCARERCQFVIFTDYHYAGKILLQGGLRATFSLTRGAHPPCLLSYLIRGVIKPILARPGKGFVTK